MINTILFDWDGTLLNSNELIRQSHLHVLEKHFPGVYNQNSIKEFNGFPLNEIYYKIWPERQAELVNEFTQFSEAEHDRLVALFPGVKEVLLDLKNEGFRLAVVSTKRKAMLQRGIDLFDLDTYFDIILGGGQFEHSKPHPESLLLAMQTLKSSSSQTIMVGDNWQDIQAAHNAGVRGIFVEWSEKTLQELEPIRPDKTIKSMFELASWLMAEKEKEETI